MVDNTILIVEPDAGLRTALVRSLKEAGLIPRPALHGNVMELLEEEHPALILLDTAVKRIDTLHFCRVVRERFDMPLVLLTTREDDPLALEGLRLGADDYLVKPVRTGILVAKVRAHIRRYSMIRRPSDTSLRLRDLEIDMASGIVRRGEDVLSLTRTEYRLLVGLARRAGRVCTSSELFEWLWRQPDGGDARSIQVHVSNLRKKLEPNPERPSYVVTVRGQGYKFNPTDHRTAHLA